MRKYFLLRSWSTVLTSTCRKNVIHFASFFRELIFGLLKCAEFTFVNSNFIRVKLEILPICKNKFPKFLSLMFHKNAFCKVFCFFFFFFNVETDRMGVPKWHANGIKYDVKIGVINSETAVGLCQNNSVF